MTLWGWFVEHLRPYVDDVWYRGHAICGRTSGVSVLVGVACSDVYEL